MSLKKMTVRRFVASGAAVALAVSGAIVSATAPANAAPSTGGTLYFFTHAEQFDHVDPQRVYVGRDIAFFNSYLYRNLVMYKPTTGPAGSSLVGDLATNTGVPSNQAKTWKFTLRPGVTWEDGSAITCADVKYGISRTFAQDVITDGPTYATTMLNIPAGKYKGPYSKEGQDLFDKAVTCSSDNRTVTFNLSRSVSDFNYAMTYPAFSPVKATKDTGDKYDLRPFASGPYKLESYVINDEMHLVRNTAWKKATDPNRNPYPDDIRVRFGVDEDLRDSIFTDDSIKNAVNLDGLKPVANKAFFANPANASRRLNVYDPYVRYGAMNVSAGKMDCLEVRQAVFFAINTQALIDLSGGREFYGDPGDNPIKPVLGLDYAPTTGNIHDPAWKITGNPDKAKELLATAKTKCPTTYDKATNAAKGITYDLSNTATNQKASVLIKDALTLAGINVKFNFIPSGQYYSTIGDTTKQSDISAAGWGADWANASTVIPELFTKEGGANYTQNWNDPAYAAFKAKSDKALAETDRKKQAAMWKELAQYVMDQYWIIRPIFSKGQFVWNSGVGGVGYWEPQGHFLFTALYVK